MIRQRMMSMVAVVLAVIAAPSAVAAASSGSTSRISVTSSGGQATEYRSEAVAVTPTGRYVLFTSAAPNLVPGDSNETWDTFLRDRLAGTTVAVSVTVAGVPGDSSSFGAAISADGRYVLFTSSARNLVPGHPVESFDVYVRDRWAGVTSLVSTSSRGVPGDGASFAVGLSPDGRFVTFASRATNLVPGDTNGGADVFVRDRWTGVTSRVNVSSTGAQANGESYEIALTPDGRYAAFTSEATNLVPGDTNGAADVFVRDRWTGQTSRVSVSGVGAQGTMRSILPDISADGRYVSFTSDASNLVPGDTNGVSDIIVRDRWTGTTTRVVGQPNGASYDATISPDGRYLTFTSDATNLVPGDANGAGDVFQRDRWSGTTTLVSVSGSGTQGNGYGYGPAPSPDGRWVAFSSEATNLVPGDTNGVGDVFLRRLR